MLRTCVCEPLHLALVLVLVIWVTVAIVSSHHPLRDAADLPSGVQKQVVDGDDDNGIKLEDVWVHAFDLGLCGLAKFRPWQEQENAFNCSSGRRSGRRQDESALRIINGTDALASEFPSYVQLNKTYDLHDKSYHECGATLIDRNYAVTAAHCVANTPSMALTFGSSKLNGQGGQVRRGAKWCYPADYEWVNVDGTPLGFVGIHSDLAIIRFDTPIQYKLDHIWPACVNLNARHSPGATCAFAGLGRTGVDLDSPFSEHLLTLPAQRKCEANFKNENSCYLGTREGVQGLQGIHRGDSGSPLICYDHCADDARTQAFAVGAVSDYWLNPGVNLKAGIADFHLQRAKFLKLLKAAQREGDETVEGIVCKKPYSVPDPPQEEQVDDIIKLEDVWVHAFDRELCGLATFRPWQEQESAFNCTSSQPRSNATTPRIINGLDALEGEFPSYVQMNATYNNVSMHNCGATLIDKNYLVTAAQCVADMTEPMKLTFGSGKLNGQAGQVRVANKWCYPSSFERVNTDGTPLGFVGIHSDLAVIRFDTPIQYKLDQIWPACLDLNARHSANSTCALIGLGKTGSESKDKFASHLQTLPARRACEANLKNENSCYLGTREGVQGVQGIHSGDSGSPLICYDHCAADARTQAFAVGAVSDYWINPGVNIKTGVADFHLQRVKFLKLLKAAQREGDETVDGIVCISRMSRFA